MSLKKLLKVKKKAEEEEDKNNLKKMDGKNLAELANLAAETGDKYVIVEEGRPMLVLMNFHAYRKMIRNIYGEEETFEEYLENHEEEIEAFPETPEEVLSPEEKDDLEEPRYYIQTNQ